jgi:predicted phosphodiesterase
MRTALISDLHGNDVALRAVLAHIADARVDRIVCLGDVATLGPAPQRVLETLAELACPCILGNHDEFLLDADLIRRYTEIPVIVQAVERRATVMAGGHTHIQMLRQHQGTLLVNPGSLGLPFEQFASGGPPRVPAHAEYAIVDSAGGAVGVTLNRVPVDRGALIAAVERWDNPLRDWLLQQYRS